MPVGIAFQRKTVVVLKHSLRVGVRTGPIISPVVSVTGVFTVFQDDATRFDVSTYLRGSHVAIISVWALCTSFKAILTRLCQVTRGCTSHT